jgi:hypothetical protein
LTSLRSPARLFRIGDCRSNQRHTNHQHPFHLFSPSEKGWDVQVLR